MGDLRTFPLRIKQNRNLLPKEKIAIVHSLFIIQRRSQPNVRDVQVLGRSRDFNEPRVEGEGGGVEAFGGREDGNDGLG